MRYPHQSPVWFLDSNPGVRFKHPAILIARWISMLVSDLVNHLVIHADRAAREHRVPPRTRRRKPRHHRRLGILPKIETFERTHPSARQAQKPEPAGE